MATDYKAKLEALGYEVGEPGEAMPNVIHVSGYGVSSYFDLSDAEALDSMLDPDAQAEREYQSENPDETIEEREARWAAE